MDCGNTPYNLLARYLADECVASEQEQLIQWRRESFDNKLTFDWYKQLWDEPFMNDSAYMVPDKNQIWERIATHEQKGGEKLKDE